jgi:methyl coenzyme M reductase subunit D
MRTKNQNKKNWVIVVVLAIIITSVGVMIVNMNDETVVIKEIDYPGRLYAGGISLGLKDNNMSMIEEILTENLPVSYTIKK